jgi:peptidoglycan/xylan/chitin deacetylase (PgdA/CDA1 family)
VSTVRPKARGEMDERIKFGLKRLVKLLISLGVFCFSYMCDTLRRLMGKPVPARCVILYYHAIPSGQRELFARQMDTLVRWAKPIPADSRLVLRPAERYAAVTFDDAYESVLVVALPELRKRKIPATVFVITGALGRSMGWEGYPEKVMTLDQLNQLPIDLITIGSHTVTHPNLSLVSEDEARTELCESRKKLEELLHRKIALFSFPYGAFETKMVEWCREAGYERIFTTLPHLAFSNPQEFVTGRVPVEPDDRLLEFNLKLFGAYRWLPWAFSLKRKLFSNPMHRAKVGKTKAPNPGAAQEAVRTRSSGRRI